MLESAGQSGPYVLVGMELVDSPTVDAWVDFQANLSPNEWEAFEQSTIGNPELNAGYLDAESFWTAPLADDPNVGEVRRVCAESPLQPMPLVVLSHGIPFEAPFTGWPTDEMEQVKSDHQTWLAQLVPGATHIIVEQSGHNIYQDQPEIVIEVSLTQCAIRKRGRAEHSVARKGASPTWTRRATLANFTFKKG